jgi:hypothetical protein
MDILDTEEGTKAGESQKSCLQRMTNYISEENMGMERLFHGKKEE